ncbi:hypothetical protein AMR72_05850 [Flavobacterium psychrophilum]|nr:hypothetical protein AMR72_05850 [Flavobacterium psychrophilum]AOE52084.1 hypothetical protein ALW18_05845 [Flavobacterium psychrophilum]
MIKNTVTIIASSLIVILTGCSGKQNFYHGYVYDLDTRKPLKNVTVKECNLKPLTGSTDSTGYFNIENNTQGISDLVFITTTHKQDTARTVWSQHGERIEYSFINKKPDTIYLKKL